MTVHCSHCGEPLMGSVNRCWRCGRSLAVVAGEPDLPPIRRAPVDLRPSPTATPVDQAALPAESTERSAPHSANGPPASADSTTSTRSETQPQDTTASTVGNPPLTPVLRRPIRPKYPKQVFAESCAITSVVVGVLTAFTSILTAWSLIPALVGIVLGVVGLGSDRRRTAAVGIALCCFVVLISAGRISVWAYRAHERRQMELYGEF